MFRFSIRDLLWLFLVAALALGRWKDRTELKPLLEKIGQLQEQAARDHTIQTELMREIEKATGRKVRGWSYTSGSPPKRATFTLLYADTPLPGLP